MDLLALIAKVREIIAAAQVADTWQAKIAVGILVVQFIADLMQKLQAAPEPTEPIRMAAAAPCGTVEECCAALESVCADHAPTQGKFAAGGGGAFILLLMPLLMKLLERLLSK